MDPRIQPGSDGRFRIWNDRTKKWTVYETEDEAVRALPKAAPKKTSDPLFGGALVEASHSSPRKNTEAARHAALENACAKAMAGEHVRAHTDHAGKEPDATARLVIVDDVTQVSLCYVDHYASTGWEFSFTSLSATVAKLHPDARKAALRAVESLTHKGTVPESVGYLEVGSYKVSALARVRYAMDLRAEEERVTRNASRREADARAAENEAEARRSADRAQAERERLAREPPDQPHIKEFSDGFRVWSPALGRYLQDGFRGAFETREAAQYKLAEVLGGAKRSRTAAAPSLFTDAPRKGEQTGLLFRQNPRRAPRAQGALFGTTGDGHVVRDARTAAHREAPDASVRLVLHGPWWSHYLCDVVRYPSTGWEWSVESIRAAIDAMDPDERESARRIVGNLARTGGVPRSRAKLMVGNSQLAIYQLVDADHAMLVVAEAERQAARAPTRGNPSPERQTAPRRAPKAPTRPRTAAPSGLYPCVSPAIGQRVTIEGRGPAESIVGDVLGCYRDPTTGRAGYAVGQTVSRGRVTGALRRDARRTGAMWDARKGRLQGMTRRGFRAGDVEPRNVPMAPERPTAAPARVTVEPFYMDDVMARLDEVIARAAKPAPAVPGAKKSRMCKPVCTTPDCVRCCPRQIQPADRELMLASAKAGGGSMIPYPVDTTFPHGEGESRCCVEHPLWRELGVEVDEIRRGVWEGAENEGPEGLRWEHVEDVPDARVVAALKAHPRWAEWEAQSTKCITSLEEQVERARPKGGRGSDAVELAERRRKFLEAGGDLTSREWTDTLRSTEKRQFKKYGLTSHRVGA